MFKDVNDDGFEDVLTLTRYMPVTGPKADRNRSPGREPTEGSRQGRRQHKR